MASFPKSHSYFFETIISSLLFCVYQILIYFINIILETLYTSVQKKMTPVAKKMSPVATTKKPSN